MDEGLIGIGAFAARSRLSAKALRLYDRLGLLPPAHIDPASGYRYYRVDQIERARLVALLRRLDMPLARIAGIVEADGEQGAGLLDAYWSEAETRHAERRALAGYLRRRMTGKGQEMADLYDAFTVELVEVPEQLLITETRHVLADELPVWIPAALDRLEEAAAGCGGIAGHPFVAYHAESSMESDGPAEACVPVADAGAARTWVAGQPRTRHTRTRLEPARRLAVTRVTKAQVAHPQILAAYEAVEAWMRREGWEYDGPCREVYFADWDAAGAEDPVCDIAYPVRRGTTGDRT
ncbi:MerR family transcriptional regulator [Streptomyces acidiscabies]|uniref:MerR family transcriptional regulator n=1 Tax=Streptomyces acidiscabies TaxID=42234 RepID=A0A0L0KFE2_9ACTN|nr:MerR family transcriptional regulator [Streptomyces acidiscabies]KND36553.1 MerR family transcriptional regulator [Streptomyces acidiscabies]